MPGLIGVGRVGRHGSSRGGSAWVLSGAALDFDFVNGRGFNSIDRAKLTPDSILTYTSPSPKMVYGNDGVLRYAPHNLLTYSEQFDNAAWSKSNSTITANTVAAPDGTVTAEKIVENVDVASGHLVSRNYSVIVGVPYTQSVYIKAAERSFAFVLLSGAFASTAISINLTTGALVAVVGSPLATSVSDAGNGWWRVSLTVAASSTGTGSITIYSGTGASWSNRQYNGDGVSGLYLWGAQFCTGQSALTYTPTTSAAVYSLPIDHNPTTFEPLGVLIEEQRTNLLTYSEQFDNAAWTKTDASITSNAAVAPDGTTTADKLVESAGAGIHLTSQQATKAASSASYSFSFYAKAGERTRVRVVLSAGSSNGVVVTFDLAGVQVGVAGAAFGSGWTFSSAAVSSVGNGWCRCVVTGISDSATTVRGYAQTDKGSGTAAGNYSYTGDGSSGLFLWGAQLEAGAFATSYIPTVASQVTRAADQVSILTSAFGYSAAAGTVLVEGSINGNGAGNAGWWALDAGAIQNGHSLRVAIGGDIIAISRGASSNQTVVGLASPVAGTFYETAFAYSNENDRAISTEGAAVVEGTTAVGTINSATTLRFGFQQVTTPGGYLNGHIKRLTYFPTRKSNSELQALSA